MLPRSALRAADAAAAADAEICERCPRCGESVARWAWPAHYNAHLERDYDVDYDDGE